MKIFLQYLRHRAVNIMLPVFFAAVFAGISVLYGAPAEPVIYSCVLCGAALAVVGAVDFVKFRRKIRSLKAAENAVTITCDELPEPANEIERQYRELINILYESRLSLDSENRRRTAEMTEYYTLWAHQIKTPIAAMRLILQSDDTPQSRELYEDLQRIEQYAEMVLCYIRLDSDSTDYVIRRYPLDGIIRQALRRFSSQFIRRKIRLVYDGVDIDVLTDEKWLLFVIEQVISNALKYTRQGSVTVYADGEVLCVKDTGIGIATEDLPRIFEEGFTGYNGREDKSASGIGLYLCRRICAGLGHSISAVSDEHGTTVMIDLAAGKVDTRE